jgi:hypothetical protein
MIEPDDEPPVVLPRKEQLRLLALGALLAAAGLAFLNWWPMFSIGLVQDLIEIARGLAPR